MEDIPKRCANIIEIIREKQSSLVEILTQYQPYNVAEYEIKRCIRTLNNINENVQYFKGKVSTVSVFIPSNLPLYSLVIFVLIPGFIAEELYVHPNTIMREQKIIEKLCHILQIREYFPNINITLEEHGAFIEKYVKKSKVVIFTGRRAAKVEIERIMLKDSILIFNGSGHNPVVVTENADINKAVEDSIFVKFFNSGQDCAGPDLILVHEEIASEFIDKLKEECSKLKVGKFANRDTFIGPILQKGELERLEKIISNNKDNVIYGGRVDFDKCIVYPAVIFSKITERINFSETFGPIAFITEYKDDQELKLYFQDKGWKISI